MRLTYPTRGWSEVRWAADEKTTADVAAAIATLADMPGVDMREDVGAIALPRNVWGIEPYRVLVAACDDRQFRAPQIVSYGDIWQPPGQPLYHHQKDAVTFLVAHGGGLCADQMGLGKSREAIAAAETFATGSTRHRIIIGPRHTRDVWRRELLATGAIDDPRWFWAAEGRSPTDKPIDWDCAWFFVHFDIVYWWSTWLARSPRTGPPLVAIIDELHLLKNGRTKRSTGAQALAGTAMHRIGLTGTPLPNRPGELWWPLTIIDGKRSWGSPVDFRVRYAGATHNDHHGGYEDHGVTRADELKARLSTRYIRRTIDDAGVKLPKLTRQLLHTRLEGHDREQYDAVAGSIGKDNLVRAILERRAGKDTLSAITKLRKLMSKAKMDVTLQYAVDALAAGDSIVIGVWQRSTAEQLNKDIMKVWGRYALEHEFVVRPNALFCTAHGGHSQEDRDDRVAVFQRTGGALVCTIDALKEGVTLTKARHIIIHDLSWVPSDMLQFEARVYRIGQAMPVVASWAVADDSIDILFAATLAGKADTMAAALGITAAQEAAAELGLEAFSVASSVEADIERLLAGWDV